VNQKTLFANQQRFEAWKAFHQDNPQVFSLFHRFALEALQAGEKVGARMIGERIRWKTQIETTTESPKINDHHWPYYSRLLMDIDKRFEGFFVVKDQRFDADVSEIVRVHRGR
jgi:hypothetical protein